MKNLNILCRNILSLAVLALSISACDSDVFNINSDPFKGETYLSMTDEPISSYLDEQSEFTEYVSALRYSDTYNALNQSTQGVSFTAFAPNNDAMADFYARRGVSELEDLTPEYVRSFVLYHTLGDSLTTEEFIQESSVTNLTGDEITIVIDSLNAGQATLNDEGQVIEMGISAYNGKIYVLSKAMTPLVETVYDRVVEGGVSSIMVAALQETGWDAKLSTISDTTYVQGKQTINKYYYTLFNVSDDVFAKADVYSLSDLKSVLLSRDDRGLSQDSLLREYVAYHIMSNMYKCEDLASSDGSVRIWDTSADNQVFTVSTDTVGTISSASYTLNADGESARFVSGSVDILAKNGYVHEIDSWLPVWEPEAATVQWDLTDYTEVKNIVGAEDYQPSEPVTSEARTSIYKAACYTYEMGESGSSNSSYTAIDYVTTKSYKVGTSTLTALNNDRLVLNLGYMGTVSMKSPVLVKGKYKVELTMVYTTTQSFMRLQTDGNGGLVKFSFDEGEETSYSTYSSPYTTVSSALPGIYSTTIFDEVEFTETSTHTLTLLVLDSAASTNKGFSLQFDCITFTPIQ